MSVTDDRLDTIDRAIDLLETAAPVDLYRWLAQTNAHAHLKADIDAFHATLIRAPGTPGMFSAWKVSQQLLKAAGLPYGADA